MPRTSLVEALRTLPGTPGGFGTLRRRRSRIAVDSVRSVYEQQTVSLNQKRSLSQPKYIPNWSSWSQGGTGRLGSETCFLCFTVNLLVRREEHADILWHIDPSKTVYASQVLWDFRISNPGHIYDTRVAQTQWQCTRNQKLLINSVRFRVGRTLSYVVYTAAFHQESARIRLVKSKISTLQAPVLAVADSCRHPRASALGAACFRLQVSPPFGSQAAGRRRWLRPTRRLSAACSHKLP